MFRSYASNEAWQPGVQTPVPLQRLKRMKAAVLSARSAGISAQLSTRSLHCPAVGCSELFAPHRRFEFSLEKAGRGHILAFSVMGCAALSLSDVDHVSSLAKLLRSEDDELLLGKVEVISSLCLNTCYTCSWWMVNDGFRTA